MLTGKIWGETALLLNTPLIEVHRLTVKPFARCSLHRHAHKWNAFVVISGRLIIEVHKSDYDLVDQTELLRGELTTVKPGEDHRFMTEDEPVEALEIYYPESLSEDIVRKDCGGMVVSAAVGT